MSFPLHPRTPVTQQEIEEARKKAKEAHCQSVVNAWMGPGPRGAPCPCGMPSDALATDLCRSLKSLWVPTDKDRGGDGQFFDTQALTDDLRHMCESVMAATDGEVEEIREAAGEIFRLKYGQAIQVAVPAERGALQNFLTGAVDTIGGTNQRWVHASVLAGREAAI